MSVTQTFIIEYGFLGVPEVKDSVTRILESRGIKYSHRNDDVLVPNAIEEQQMRKARKVWVVRFDQINAPHCFGTGTTATSKEGQGKGSVCRVRL
jgi:Helicase-associated putative binding domain, C-terminal